LQQKEEHVHSFLRYFLSFVFLCSFFSHSLLCKCYSKSFSLNTFEVLKRRGVITSKISNNWRPQNLFLLHIWGLERRGVIPNKILNN
jgi:hypothetical protein